jgi:addiction module RelE/StbE family toxin
MRKLVHTNQFDKSYKHFVKSFPYLQKGIDKTIQQMEEDIYHTSLKTHKLSGSLYGLKACSCGYDCRIIFTIETIKETGIEEIILINIGTHEVVY